MSKLAKRRQFILELIPCREEGISTKELADNLINNGYIKPVKDPLRTVLRDMDELMAQYRVIELVDENARPKRYRIADGFSHPVNPSAKSSFIALRIIEQEIKALIPPTFEQEFNSVFSSLENSNHKKVNLWRERFIHIPRDFQVKPSEVNEGFFYIIEEALTTHRDLRATYNKPSASKPKEYLLTPLGVMLRGREFVLIAYNHNSGREATFVLARFVEMKITFSTLERKERFDIEKFAEHEATFFSGGELTEVILKVDRKKGASYIYETHIGENQRIIDDSDADSVTISTTVRNSRALHTWLFKYSDIIEVTSPSCIRSEVIASIQRARDTYQIA